MGTVFLMEEGRGLDSQARVRLVKNELTKVKGRRLPSAHYAPVSWRFWIHSLIYCNILGGRCPYYTDFINADAETRREKLSKLIEKREPPRWRKRSWQESMILCYDKILGS